MSPRRPRWLEPAVANPGNTATYLVENSGALCIIHRWQPETLHFSRFTSPEPAGQSMAVQPVTI